MIRNFDKKFTFLKSELLHQTKAVMPLVDPAKPGHYCPGLAGSLQMN